MKKVFDTNCLPLLIGSLPMNDHLAATRMVLDYTPEIPLWVQLPQFKEEGMMAQFIAGMPAVATKGDRLFIDVDSESYDAEFLGFFEEYIEVSDNDELLPDSRFALHDKSAGGFHAFIEVIRSLDKKPKALKGQITGPITFCTGVSDHEKQAIFYNESLRDAAVKHLAMNAKWQIKILSEFDLPVIIFIDEPALAGYGSSEFISISREEIARCLGEVTSAIDSEGGISGIHVCANTDWSLVLESGVDIVNFDAYSYFDKLALYPDQIKEFVENGGILAWGLVPTLKADEIMKETVESLFSSWLEKSAVLENMGIDREKIFRQSLITPSCGTGALPLELAESVMALTRDLSEKIRGGDIQSV